MDSRIWGDLFGGIRSAAELRAHLFACSKIPEGVRDRAEIATAFVNYVVGAASVDILDERPLLVCF